MVLARHSYGDTCPLKYSAGLTLLSGNAWLKPVFGCVHHELHGGLHALDSTWRQAEKGTLSTG